MMNKDPQLIQRIYPIIDFSEVSHSKGENILLYFLSLKIDLSFWHLSSDFKRYFSGCTGLTLSPVS